MDYTRRILLAAILVMLVGLLVGCDQSSVRVGWVETSSPGSHIVERLGDTVSPGQAPGQDV